MFEIKVSKSKTGTELTLLRRTARGARLAVPGGRVHVQPGQKVTVADIEELLAVRGERLLGGRTRDGTE